MIINWLSSEFEGKPWQLFFTLTNLIECQSYLQTCKLYRDGSCRFNSARYHWVQWLRTVVGHQGTFCNTLFGSLSPRLRLLSAASHFSPFEVSRPWYDHDNRCYRYLGFHCILQWCHRFTRRLVRSFQNVFSRFFSDRTLPLCKQDCSFVFIQIAQLTAVARRWRRGFNIYVLCRS